MKGEIDLCPGCFQQELGEPPCPRCGYRPDPEAFPTALQPGTVLSRYTVGRVLGKPGGFGITYLAFDPVLDRRLALKELMPRELVARRPDGETLHVQTRDDEELFKYTLASFLNEARLIAQLSHPNLVRVLDFFEANGTAYFAMEYYEGETMAERVERAGGRLREDEAISLILPLLDALDHIHSRDEPILHRDIKPSNVYLTGERTPILLDFGAARVAMGQQSRSLSAVLTPGFAPYEQYSTRGNQGPWTDVYGCAATLYFLVTGQAPPEASVRIEDPRIDAPRTLVPELPEGVSDAIVRGLGFRPRDRPQSAREFKELLTGTVRARPEAAAVAPPDPATPREAPTVVGGRTPPGRTTDLALGPVGTGGGEDAARTVVASVPSGGSRGRRRPPVWMAGGVAMLFVASAAFGLTRVLGEADEPAPAPETAEGDAVDRPEPGDVLLDDGPEEPSPTVVTAPAPDPVEAEATTTADPEPPEPTPATETATAPPSPAPQPTAAAPAAGILVIVYGDEPRGAQQAETALLRSLAGQHGLQPLDPSSLSMIRGDQSAVEAANRGDFSALAAISREHGAEFLVVGDLSSRASASVGRFFTGTAEMDLKMYRVSTGNLVDAGTFRVGSGGAQAILAASEGEARSRAAEEAGNQAASAARTWLARAFR